MLSTWLFVLGFLGLAVSNYQYGHWDDAFKMGSISLTMMCLGHLLYNPKTAPGPAIWWIFGFGRSSSKTNRGGFSRVIRLFVGGTVVALLIGGIISNGGFG